MMYERMLDKSHTPSEEDLTRYCGENGGRFRELNTYLCEQFDTVREVRFPYGNKYGWCITHRKGKSLVCDVFAEAGAFCVMLRLSDDQFSAEYDQLLPYTQQIIDKRYPCSNGGWIHYRVTDDAQLHDIELLLCQKCGKPTKR